MNRNINRDDLIWICGFFDGEGCIRIGYDSASLHSKFSIFIFITNTNKQCLIRIRNELHIGSIKIHKEETKTHKTCYHLIFQKNEFKELLQTILPFLRIKKYQALIMLRWLKETTIFHCVKGIKNNERRMTIKESGLRYSLFEEITLLNKRGPHTNEELEEIKDTQYYYDCNYNELIQ